MDAKINISLLQEKTANISPTTAWKIMLIAFNLIECETTEKVLSRKELFRITKIQHVGRLMLFLTEIKGLKVITIKELDGMNFEVSLSETVFSIKKKPKRKKPTPVSKEYTTMLEELRTKYHPRRAYIQKREAEKEFKKIMDDSKDREVTFSKILSDIEVLKTKREWDDGTYIQGLGNYLKSKTWDMSMSKQTLNNCVNVERTSQMDEINSLLG